MRDRRSFYIERKRENREKRSFYIESVTNNVMFQAYIDALGSTFVSGITDIVREYLELFPEPEGQSILVVWAIGELECFSEVFSWQVKKRLFFFFLLVHPHSPSRKHFHSLSLSQPFLLTLHDSVGVPPKSLLSCL